MSKFAFAAEVLPGHLNAMVKNLMRQAGIRDPNEAVRAFNAGELILSPRDPQALLKPVGDPVVLPAVAKFTAKDAFTKANGVAYLGDNFKQYILPVVEENVPEVAVRVWDLTRAARDIRIAAQLNVDETGELSLTHYFQAIQRKFHTWLAAYVIGSDNETWAVRAYLGSGGWGVFAFRPGDRDWWRAGDRFLSR